MRGLTLIEILLIVGIMAILLAISLPLGLDFYKNQQLESQARGISQTIRRAQLKSMSGEIDSSFGVYLTNDNYILFKGDSFLTRDSQYDEVFELPEVITLQGLSEIVFLKLEGIPKENPPSCQGICTPCNEFSNQGSCQKQTGCTWVNNPGQCQGACLPCESYQARSQCQNQSGCSWELASRGGNIILKSNGDNRVININEIGRVSLK